MRVFRIITLGVFALVGLALAIVVAARLTNESEVAEKQADLPPLTAIVRASPIDEEAAKPTQVASTNTRETTLDDVKDLLDESMNRWTAAYLPAVTRQFELLEKVQETVTSARQAAENAAQLQTIPVPAAPVAQQPAAPPVNTQKATPPEDITTPVAPSTPGVPEVQRNADQDLVSVNAPNSDIREVLKTLSDASGLNILATPSVAGTVSVSLNNVGLEEALSAILKSSGYSSRREKNFVYVGTVEEIKNLATANDSVGTRVYRPNYVTAAELQKLFTPMLSKDVGTIAISTASEIGITSGSDTAGGDTYAGGEVVLVRDFETILQQTDEVFHEVDLMPAQVAIEAMILSVRLDDTTSLGVDFELLRNKDNIRIVSGATADSLATLNFADGLKVGFLDESLFAFIDALESVGDTNVIASPHVMCLNKQRAEILIGSELGYVSTTVTETAATQTVEFLEVGTHLKIRPFISGDGMVRLEVHPELSTGTVRIQGGFTLPDKDVTQVTTNIMCRSGATIILGGLIREDLVTTSTQIPVLGNLPLFGALFRQRSEDTERREIIVLLTPRVLDEPEMHAEAQHASTQFRDRRNAFFDKMQPINKRRIGERYHRLAIAAWAAQDADTALRYANLAIHYDPLLQGAVDLRQEVLAVRPELEQTVHRNLKRGLPPWEHPLHDYSPETGVPWREIGPVEQSPDFSEPVHTGRSGAVRTIITDREVKEVE